MGADPLLVGTSLGWPGNLAFVWLIDKDAIIHQNLIGSDWVDPQQVICRYVAACLEHSAEVRRYRESEHSVALVSGSPRIWATTSGTTSPAWSDCYGMTFWSALTRSTRPRIPGFRPPRSSRTSCRSRCASCHLRRRCSCGSSTTAAFRPRSTATSIDRALAARVRRAAQRLAARGGTGLVERLDIAASSSKFIFFVNLRAHNKAWLEQVQGVAAMAQRLDAHHGCDVLIYLDGYKDCDETIQRGP